MKKLGNVEDAPSASSDAFFLFHRRCLRAGMNTKETTLSLFDCIKIKSQ